MYDTWPLRYVMHMARFESYIMQRKFGWIHKPDPMELGMARIVLRAANLPPKTE